jgi:NADH pyrophosphatase NudC (nudix superfamily)
MMSLLEKAKTSQNNDFIINQEQEALLEKNHHRLWLDIRAAHIEQVEQQAQTRLASLQTTHVARIRLLEDQRDSVADPKIRRMREAQIDAATRDYQEHVQKMETAKIRADILAEAVVFGMLEIRN